MTQIQVIWEATGAAVLLCNAVRDIRTRKIFLPLSVLYGVAGLILELVTREGGLREAASGLLFSCIPGVLFLLLARISEEKIGYGDGILVLVFGIGLGLYENLFALQAALLLAGVTSLVLLVLKKVRKKDTLPFAPFFAAGFFLRHLF